MRKRILLAEDNPVVAAALIYFLEVLGYEVEAHANAKCSVEAFIRNNFAFAIIDLRLFESSGLEVIETIMKKCPDKKVLATTGYPHTDIEQIVEDMGIPVWHKPFSFENLKRWLEDEN